MNAQAYYRLNDATGCDLREQGSALVVNCTGVCVIPEDFTAGNPTGRRDYYLMYFPQDELAIDFGTHTQTARAGDVLIHTPGSPYRYAKRSAGTLVYYWVHFTGYGAQALLDSCALATGRLLHSGVDRQCIEAFHRLFGDFIARDDCFTVSTAAQLAQICTRLHRRRAVDVAEYVRGADRIRASLDYLHRHYSAPISIARLAEIEHLSVSRYCAVFRECMGVSPQCYWIDLRLKMAAELMRSTDLNIKQIARMVGYDDQLYFSRRFKAGVGMPPSQYAQQMRRRGR